jgi:hypothetical protein
LGHSRDPGERERIHITLCTVLDGDEWAGTRGT